MEQPQGRLRCGRACAGTTPPRRWGGSRPNQRDGSLLSLWTTGTGTSLRTRQQRGVGRGGGERRGRPANKSTGRPRRRLRGRGRSVGAPWVMLSRTWSRRGRGSGCLRSGGGRGTAPGVPSPPLASPRGRPCGDGFPNEAARGGRGVLGGAAAGEATVAERGRRPQRTRPRRRSWRMSSQATMWLGRGSTAVLDLPVRLSIPRSGR